ncbi:MAG: hypothetical protein ACYDBJ_25300 [Aggregatilineales bacterium]
MNPEVEYFIRRYREELNIVFYQDFDYKYISSESGSCSVWLVPKSTLQRLEGQTQIKAAKGIFFIRLCEMAHEHTVQSLDLDGQTGGWSANSSDNPQITEVVRLLRQEIQTPVFWNQEFSFMKEKKYVFPYIVQDRVIGAIVVLLE